MLVKKICQLMKKQKKFLKAIRDFEHCIRKGGIVKAKNKYDKELFEGIGGTDLEWQMIEFAEKSSKITTEFRIIKDDQIFVIKNMNKRAGDLVFLPHG